MYLSLKWMFINVLIILCMLFFLLSFYTKCLFVFHSARLMTVVSMGPSVWLLWKWCSRVKVGHPPVPPVPPGWFVGWLSISIEHLTLVCASWQKPCWASTAIWPALPMACAPVQTKKRTHYRLLASVSEMYIFSSNAAFSLWSRLGF